MTVKHVAPIRRGTDGDRSPAQQPIRRSGTLRACTPCVNGRDCAPDEPVPGVHISTRAGATLCSVGSAALLDDAEAAARAVRYVADTHPSDATNF